MQTLTISGFKDAIYYGAILNNEPLMGWGAPGIGKSAALYQLVAWLNECEIEVAAPAKAGQNARITKKRPGATLTDVRLSQYDSVDMRGIPDVQNRATVWNPPATLPFEGNPNFNSDPGHVNLLFLDEFTHGNEAVMAVAYQLVNDGRVGEHKLLSNVRIVAASNREGDKSISRKMPKALGNRFTHVEVILSLDDFCVHAHKSGMHPMGPMFLQFRPALLSTFMVEVKGKQEVTQDIAFATPRSWEKALGYYADDRIPHATKVVLMAGAIGNGPAGEFWGFEKAYEQLSTLIPAVLKDPHKAPVPEARDVMFAVTVGLAGNMTKKNADTIHTYYQRLDREFVMLGWIMATKLDDGLQQTNAYLDFAKKYKVQ